MGWRNIFFVGISRRVIPDAVKTKIESFRSASKEGAEESSDFEYSWLSQQWRRACSKCGHWWTSAAARGGGSVASMRSIWTSLWCIAILPSVLFCLRQRIAYWSCSANVISEKESAVLWSAPPPKKKHEFWAPPKPESQGLNFERASHLRCRHPPW